MTDRRRNLFILLLVAGLLIASGVAIATKKTREGLDLKGGVSLVYQAKPTKFSKVTGDALQRTLDIMRDRVDQLGVAEPEIQRSGSDQIDVSLPDVKNAGEAEKQVGQVAQMFFYDWEPNVVGPDGKAHPADPNVTGGPSAGTVGALPEYDAVIRASRRPAHHYPLDTTNGTYYLISDKGTSVPVAGKVQTFPARSVVRGPEDTQDALLAELPGKSAPKGTRIVKVNEGTILVQAEQDNPKVPKPNLWYVLNDNPALRGTDIKNPEQNFDQQTNVPNVTFDFTGHGRKVWHQATRAIANRGRDSFIPGSNVQSAFQHFAIVLDNQIISAPYIDFQQNPDGIDGINGSEIQGGFTIESAQRLANLLKSGALPLKLERISVSQVSATLGKQALHQGLIAGIVGLALVMLFMLVFYRVLGLIAIAGLVVYGIYFFALIKLIPITLTLPGIAGLILTIGVAADANIVIFERVKEEIRAGRSVAAGIAAGYKRGIAAIIDANVVTFMTAFILFILATAGVKGFAFTLGIGTLASLFTAVLATQAVLGSMGRSRLISHPRALGAGSQRTRWRYDFMGASKWFFSMSGVILLVGALAVGGKGLHFGIDFESGTRVEASLIKPANETGIRDVMSTQGYGDAKIQRVSGKEFGKNAFQISTPTESEPKLAAVQRGLDQKYGIRDFNNTTIGPTFGKTIANSAIIAIIASLIVISAYIAIRFEWKYAVPVLIALMHDLLITSGVYSLTGREVTTSTVAALLTILGYSLYDTIIVFDRVRENVPRMPRAAFSQIVNRSMSEVLTRSLATTSVTLIPILSLLLFGGSTLKDFAFALLVGVASGAYSSIFIASPVLTHWKEREPAYARRRVRLAQEFGGVVPAYAVATAGAPVDVAPPERVRRSRRITAPDDGPGAAVSKTEFAEMVREIQEDVPTTATATREPDPTADLTPEDLVLKDTAKDKRPKQKRPRNRRHGRSR
jgi:SecD/SecF fusion protein